MFNLALYPRLNSKTFCKGFFSLMLLLYINAENIINPEFFADVHKACQRHTSHYQGVVFTFSELCPLFLACANRC